MGKFFIFLILGEITVANFVELKNEIPSFKRAEGSRWSRKFDFIPDSSIPKGKSKKLKSNSNKPTKKPTKSKQSGMWGR